MARIALYESPTHRNVLLDQASVGDAEVQANQHLIIHEGGGLILDPGGHKVYSRVLTEAFASLSGGQLELIFLSHQDPDIVSSTNGWLMTTNAVAWTSKLWLRFIPHVGLDRLVLDRLKGIPDEGMFLELRGCRLMVLPAHFLHSPGNFHLYDPVSKILYSGDVGTSIDHGYDAVKDFDEHVPFMERFHQRHMSTNRMLRAWVKMVRGLDVELIAPQHGAFFRGKEMVERFLSWLEGLAVGVDLLSELKAPVR